MNTNKFLFRGRSIKDNNLVIGGIVNYFENDIPHCFIVNFNGQIFHWVEVYPDSIEQFVCHDSEGNKLFENDVAKDENVLTYLPRLIKCFWIEEKSIYIPDWRAATHYLKLKPREQNNEIQN